jgi:hypothetical protein
MFNPSLWETANGVLSILGWFIVLIVLIYLLRNIRKTYDEPIRFITLAFGFVILGHTIKDSSAFLQRCCNYSTPDWLLILSVIIVGLGKLGCIKIWSDPKWGNWPWLVAGAAVIAFLVLAPP